LVNDSLKKERDQFKTKNRVLEEKNINLQKQLKEKSQQSKNDNNLFTTITVGGIAYLVGKGEGKISQIEFQKKVDK